MTKIWLETILLTNREIQKFLFLNQFDLKKIFNKVCLDQESTDSPREGAKPKRKSVRRVNTIKSLDRKSSVLLPGIDEEVFQTTTASKRQAFKARSSTLAAEDTRGLSMYSGDELNETQQSHVSASRRSVMLN